MRGKPLASLSLDLDNQWSYMKTHGDSGWEAFPSYLDVFVPHALGALEALGLRITVFVVGQDAALERNRDALGLLSARGHEAGNHSFHHEPWIHRLSRDRIRRELGEAAEAIERATGQRPVGYRGPGFSWNGELLDLLARAGYLYDASTLPTYIGPLARLYYLRRSTIEGEDAVDERRNLFGGFREGRRPIRPYLWRLDAERTLLEIPVTTVPVLKTPFHLSYLLYLSRFSTLVMLTYLRAALRLCRLTGTGPSFLLHPLDLLGRDQAPQLAFFPGMDIEARRKLDIFNRVLRELGRHFTLVTMSEHARQLLRGDLPLRAAGGDR
jgi:hypothetical protein